MTDTPAEAPAPDLVKLLLFRSSDEAGIGWTPNTVVHVPAGLLHNAADTITALRAENERLRAALEEVSSIGPASDAFANLELARLHHLARAALKEDRT